MPKSPQTAGEQPHDPDETEAPPSKEELDQLFADYDTTWRKETPLELAELMLKTLKQPTLHQIIRLREDAAKLCRERRGELLRGAKFKALSQLYSRLAGKMSLDACKADARLIEIVEEMERRNHEVAHIWDESLKEQEDAHICLIESIGGNAPSLPATLPDALRWAAGVSDDFPMSPLQRAFIDLLSASSAKEHHKRITYWGESDAAAWVKRYETAMAAPNLAADQLAVYKAELLKYTAMVNQEKALANFAERFKPQMPVPPLIEGDGERNFATYWESGEIDLQGMAFFAEQFRPFWAEHGPVYIELHEALGREAEAVSKRNQAAGKASHAKRTKAKWEKFTRGFCEWSDGREITDGLIESYPRQPDVNKAKGAAFLKTLLNATKHNELRAELINLLNVEGVTLPEESAGGIIRECMGILEARISAKP